MSTDSQIPDSAGTGSTEALGQLRIEVPHWSADVRVFDNLFRPVPLPPLRPTGATPDMCVIEVALPAGVYDVQVGLADKIARKSAVVRPGKRPAIFSSSDWGELGLGDDDPSIAGTMTRGPYTAAAERWSRELTWHASPGGESRLFIFVRAEDPARYPDFARGVLLRGISTKLPAIILQAAARMQPDEGWMAFTADLPPGYYVLEREQRGDAVPAREQPLYLSPGWETHVFVPARDYLALGALTLSLARRGRGYVPDNSVERAINAVFDVLRRGTGGRQLITKDHIEILINGEHANPWLGVLAAYALVQSMEEREWSNQKGDDRESAWALLFDLQQYLERTIGDHPDVAALSLAQPGRIESSRSFPYPPLIRLGLRLVQRYATRDANAIPFDSLTYSVLRRLLANSPWTAWRSSSEAAIPSGITADDRKPRRSAVVKAVLASQTLPSKAPIYRFEQRSNSHMQFETVSDTGASARALAQSSDILRDATLIRLGQLLDERKGEALPDKISFDEKGMVEELLSRTSPEDISKECGISLAEASRGWQALRRSGDPSAVLESLQTGTASEDDAVVTAVQKSILTCALAKRSAATVQSPALGVESDTPEPVSTPQFSIEDAVKGLRDVAELLESASHQPADATAAERRIRKLSDELLRRASIVAITDPQGQILSANGALLMSLSSDEGEAVGERRAKWESALAAAPSGSSTITDPTGEPDPWMLDRTVVEDAASGTVRSYVNVLRLRDAHNLPQDALDEIEASVARLTLAASLFAYGSDEGRAGHLNDVQSEVDNLHGRLQNT